MSDPAGDPFTEAGEYVLGTLDLSEMRQAEARQSTDPAFADAVMFWEDRLTPLSALVAPVAPPLILWARLALATGLREPAAGGNSRFWQGATGAALLLAAAIAGVAFLPRQPDIAGARFAAALAPLNVAVPFLAETTPDGQVLITRLGDAPVPPGRTLQLWELKAGATAPVSLGLLGGQTMVVPKDAGPWDQTKLLVSQEPAGGSPTGQPTGPVLFGGQLSPVVPRGR